MTLEGMLFILVIRLLYNRYYVCIAGDNIIPKNTSDWLDTGRQMPSWPRKDLHIFWFETLKCNNIVWKEIPGKRYSEEKERPIL